MRRLDAFRVALAFLLASSAWPTNCRGEESNVLAAGAPMEGDRFMNPDMPERGGLGVAVPFFLGRAWVSMFPRAGAARLEAQRDADATRICRGGECAADCSCRAGIYAAIHARTIRRRAV